MEKARKITYFVVSSLMILVFLATITNCVLAAFWADAYVGIPQLLFPIAYIAGDMTEAQFDALRFSTAIYSVTLVPYIAYFVILIVYHTDAEVSDASYWFTEHMWVVTIPLSIITGGIATYFYGADIFEFTKEFFSASEENPGLLQYPLLGSAAVIKYSMYGYFLIMPVVTSYFASKCLAKMHFADHAFKDTVRSFWTLVLLFGFSIICGLIFTFFIVGIYLFIAVMAIGMLVAGIAPRHQVGSAKIYDKDGNSADVYFYDDK